MGVVQSGGLRIDANTDGARDATTDPIMADTANARMDTRIDEAVVVPWHVEPGQGIPAHVHPAGQDTWTILSGTGDYQIEASGSTYPISPGDIVVAQRGCVHGVYNSGHVPLRFISVVSPANAGYERIQEPSALPPLT